MKLEIVTDGVARGAGLEGFVRRKVSRALGRFAARIERVRVLLTDVNGPRRGNDIRCRLLAVTDTGRLIVVDERRSDAFEAVARAGSRASEGLARRLGRLRARRRGRRDPDWTVNRTP
jgi:hypothetical protein